MNNENSLVATGSSVGGALSAKEVQTQVQLIQQVMSSVMIDGEHFGKIPGTDKNTLFKSGAEKLLLVFRLAPRYEEISVQESRDFISYRIRCILSHQNSSTVIGEGLGACNSQEKKYRTVSVTENKASDEEKAIGKIEKRPGRNGNGSYNVYVVPANPYDVQNTMYKMACKRALVAAVLNCTAASDIFTQDLEDMDVIVDEKPNIQEPKTKAESVNKTNVVNTTAKDFINAGIALNYEDKDNQNKIKELGFKWNTAKKIWSKEVSSDEFKKLSEQFPNIEVI